jgi:uncharacterized Zn finger protein
MSTVHPRIGPRRGAARASRWWGKAWVRAVEEAAYAEADLARARALSRSGRIGGITTEPGGFVAAVEDDHGLWTVAGTVPVLDAAATEALVETVAAESGRVASLLGGDLPHDLVEHAEESGVELLPYGGELATECTCDAWVDPCVHALAVLYQLTWLLEEDPFVLLQLRGLPRDRLLARLHRRTRDAPADEGILDTSGDTSRDTSLDTGLDAALRAERILAVLDDPDASLDHLF